jgi:hypothetical protein
MIVLLKTLFSFFFIKFLIFISEDNHFINDSLIGSSLRFAKTRSCLTIGDRGWRNWYAPRRRAEEGGSAAARERFWCGVLVQQVFLCVCGLTN